MRANLRRALTAAALIGGTMPGHGLAQTTENGGGLRVELNRMEPNGEACRATFVVQNGLPADLDESGLELVVFDGEGLVSLMTVFDFGSLPQGKTVVRRFDLPRTGCGDISRILVNGVARCSGEGIDREACNKAVATDNKTKTQFGM